MKEVFAFVILVWWVAGIVLAHGFWSTLFALIPFWAFYIVVERGLYMLGWIS